MESTIVEASGTKWEEVLQKLTKTSWIAQRISEIHIWVTIKRLTAENISENHQAAIQKINLCF